MHIEAGGTSGTQVSINDSDIRDMIDKSSGSQMSFSEWYGASSGPNIERSYVYGNASTNTFFTWWDYEGFAGDHNGSEFNWGGSLLGQKYTGLRSGTNNTMSYYLHQYLNGTHSQVIQGSANGNVANNVPFPAHSGALSGWYYYNKRGDSIQTVDFYVDDFDMYGEFYYHANRVDDNSSYPH